MIGCIISSVAEDIYKPIIVYLSWVSLHYLAAHAYADYCTNWSWYGYITTPIQTMNPICKGLNWFIYESAGTISNMFIVISTTITLYLSKMKVKVN
jgi:hypothetical protein